MENRTPKFGYWIAVAMAIPAIGYIFVWNGLQAIAVKEYRLKKPEAAELHQPEVRGDNVVRHG